jgi:hypothetical protein
MRAIWEQLLEPTYVKQTRCSKCIDQKQKTKNPRLQLDGAILKEFVTKISFQIQIFSLAAFVQLNHIWH